MKEWAPDSVWQLLDWTARGDTVIVEWQDGKRHALRLARRGQIRLRDGRIVEERVYADTAPLRAAAKGERLEALIPF